MPLLCKDGMSILVIPIKMGFVLIMSFGIRSPKNFLLHCLKDLEQKLLSLDPEYLPLQPIWTTGPNLHSLVPSEEIRDSSRLVASNAGFKYPQLMFKPLPTSRKWELENRYNGTLTLLWLLTLHSSSVHRHTFVSPTLPQHNTEASLTRTSSRPWQTGTTLEMSSPPSIGESKSRNLPPPLAPSSATRQTTHPYQ